MRLCEGIDAVFGLLMDNEVVMNRLSQQDWQWLTVLKAAEVERWKEIMPKQSVAVAFYAGDSGPTSLIVRHMDHIMKSLDIRDKNAVEHCGGGMLTLVFLPI
uniref:Uncharacterized protein n=1 Tax=Parascaris equorum TaxID=6256 RepID=A0A914RC47_PAREQ